MPPRSILFLRRATAHSRLHNYHFESYSRRHISQQNLTSPTTQLRALPIAGGSLLLRSDEHLRQQIAYKHPPPPPPPYRTRNFTTTSATKMASDEDYMAFLDKANQDPNEGRAKPQSRSEEFKATDDGAQVPATIQEATKDAFYISDADEPFVPVCLAWDEGGKGLPDEGVLCVVGVSLTITSLFFIPTFPLPTLTYLLLDSLGNGPLYLFVNQGADQWLLRRGVCDVDTPPRPLESGDRHTRPGRLGHPRAIRGGSSTR